MRNSTNISRGNGSRFDVLGKEDVDLLKLGEQQRATKVNSSTINKGKVVLTEITNYIERVNVRDLFSDANRKLRAWLRAVSPSKHPFNGYGRMDMSNKKRISRETWAQRLFSSESKKLNDKSQLSSSSKVLVSNDSKDTNTDFQKHGEELVCQNDESSLGLCKGQKDQVFVESESFSLVTLKGVSAATKKDKVSIGLSSLARRER
ncbi:hypothetical protein LWI28_023484 [Acer negundo]|uniref:Uncharacterized protein n=1 Tax=Acer negundo TaxID=4023 RepID=A0AAD5NZR6_ACENE|nr:hypothetical protein LWI28_023484 [Acer negundo]